MIVCICRNIKSSEYSSEEELRDRIMQDDFQCGKCQLQDGSIKTEMKAEQEGGAVPPTSTKSVLYEF